MSEQKNIEINPATPILLVSNNNEVKFHTEKLLATAGFTKIKSTQSALEGFQLAAKEKYELLICDQEVKFSN